MICHNLTDLLLDCLVCFPIHKKNNKKIDKVYLYAFVAIECAFVEVDK